MTRVGLAAGPTGGHLLPARLVARCLRRAGCEPVLLTNAPRDHYLLRGFQGEHVSLEGRPWAGSGLTGRITAAAAILRETLRLRGVLENLTGLVSFGGYPVVPVLLAAWERGRQIFLQEQNRRPGRAHRPFRPHARRVFYGFPPIGGDPDPNHPTTGNPVREPSPPEDPWFEREPLLLVVGGSQGSREVSGYLASSLTELLGRGWSIYYVRGEFGRDLEVPADDRERVRQVSVEPDLPGVMDRADCVWARAGAGTLTELLRTGTPAVLFPLASAADDHQRANARWVARRGPARVAQRGSTDPRLEWTEELRGSGTGYRVPWAWRPSPQQRIAEAVIECLPG